MADTQINQELRDFMQKNNLDPQWYRRQFNFVSIANLLMKQQEQIDEIKKQIEKWTEIEIQDDFQGPLLWNPMDNK